jgi:hypothetical protein
MRRGASIIRSLCLIFPLLGSIAVAENLKLKNGNVYRGVQVQEVRPDAVVVSYRNGVAMADFENLPKAARVRYGIDARKTADYREGQTAARQAAAEDDRRLIAAYERRKIAQSRARIESGDAEPSSFAGSNHSELTYRPGGDRAYERTVAYVSEEIARAEEARIEEARKPETFWTAPFWKHPIMKVLSAYFAGGGSSSGFNSEPRNWH